MAEEGKAWWAIDKQAWRDHFQILFKIGSISKGREKALPEWSDADVAEFVAADSVYGPQVELVRQGAKIAMAGAAVTGAATAFICLRYSKGGTAAILGATFGGIMGWTLGAEVANYSLGLYKFSPIDANLKFLDWWSRKTGNN